MRVLLCRARGSRKINDDKPHFASRLHSFLPLPPRCLSHLHRPSPPPRLPFALVRPSVERGGIYITYFPPGLRYQKEYRALSPGAIFNRLSIVVEWRPVVVLELSARARQGTKQIQPRGFKVHQPSSRTRDRGEEGGRTVEGHSAAASSRWCNSRLTEKIALAYRRKRARRYFRSLEPSVLCEYAI